MADKVALNAGSKTPISHIVCGGFRRGKTESGDVDILITHQTLYSYENMLMPLLRMLEAAGVVETVISAHRKDFN